MLLAWTAAPTVLICLVLIALLVGGYLATVLARGRLQRLLQATLALVGLILAIVLF